MAVEVPVARTVQYDAPREGAFQITSGKYHFSAPAAAASSSPGDGGGGYLVHTHASTPVGDGLRVSRPASPPRFHSVPATGPPLGYVALDQVHVAAGHGLRGVDRDYAAPNISTLGSTNVLRERIGAVTGGTGVRERAASSPVAAPAGGGQSPGKAGGKKIGLGLKLKRNAAVLAPCSSNSLVRVPRPVRQLRPN